VAPPHTARVSPGNRVVFGDCKAFCLMYGQVTMKLTSGRIKPHPHSIAGLVHFTMIDHPIDDKSY
jgi:hypothetical protein